eukprot:1150229-Pelagomonas_calceolata.AAC.4
MGSGAAESRLHFCNHSLAYLFQDMQPGAQGAGESAGSDPPTLLACAQVEEEERKANEQNLLTVVSGRE